MYKLISAFILLCICKVIFATDFVVTDVPKIESINTNYKRLQMKFFTKSKQSSINDINSNLQDFNLSQLVVVGIINYKKKDHAFIKTPYETLMVKVGDIIKTAKIIKINLNRVELEEVQMQGDKVYKRRVYLKFDSGKSDYLISQVS